MRRSKVSAAVLLISIISSITVIQASLPAKAQTSTIPTSQEYASGDIQVSQYLQASYSWVNINGTHTIFLALHSNQLPSPVFSFIGQAYNTSSGSKVFVANALLAMDIYNDTNHNNYLDANYGSGATELRYTLLMNASQTFTAYPVNKTSINGAAHYRWGITYGTIQAILINATAPDYGYGGGLASSYTNIDHVSIFYDYSVIGNTTFLKTSYDIGTVTLVPPTNPGVTLQGLSLSLLHSTLTVASKQLTVVAGSTPYNSQTNTAPSLVTAAQVNVDNVLAYEFRFRDNYTLLNPSPTSYPAVYSASPSDSIPTNAFLGNYFGPSIMVQNFVQASLPDIAGLSATSNLNYSASQLLYRISYPTWSGNAIQHDPTYVAYLGSGAAMVAPPASSLPIIILISAVVLAGVLAIVLAVFALKRSRRTAQLTNESQPNTPVTPS